MSPRSYPEVRRYPSAKLRWEPPTVTTLRPAPRMRLRGLLIALALSSLFWLLAVVLPLWLHFGPAGVGR